MFVFGNTARRIIEQGNDQLGQCSYIKLDAQGDQTLLVVTIYQCCLRPTNEHGNSAHTQHTLMLSIMNRTNLDPRKNLYKDLKEFNTAQLDQPGKIVPIIMGNWNKE